MVYSFVTYSSCLQKSKQFQQQEQQEPSKVKDFEWNPYYIMRERKKGKRKKKRKEKKHSHKNKEPNNPEQLG